MKAFAIAAAVLPLVALAAPLNDGYKGEIKHDSKDSWGKDSWGNQDKGDHSVGVLSKYPFYFTSTYKAYATPDQV